MQDSNQVEASKKMSTDTADLFIDEKLIEHGKFIVHASITILLTENLNEIQLQVRHMLFQNDSDLKYFTLTYFIDIKYKSFSSLSLIKVFSNRKLLSLSLKPYFLIYSFQIETHTNTEL